MQIAINIDEDAYKEIKKIVADGNEMCFIQKLIANGTPLPEHHGRLIILSEDIEKEPCEDAVSRATILAEMEERYKHGDAITMGYIKGLPPVTPKQKTGKWINAKVGKLFPSNDFKCSECGNILNFDGVNCGRGDANFCPNCGLNMEGESE